MRLILASGSPRRREMFDMMGLEYEVIPSRADENVGVLPPAEMVEKLAYKKAREVYERNAGCCVVGADTIVELDGEIIGKPRDEKHAAEILSKLSGRTHCVYTGVAVLSGGSEQVCHDTTHVTFAKLSQKEIEDYIATGEPMDKAGAYGVQGVGGIFVEKVEGCYFTVIGLPLPKLYKMLRKVGIPFLSK